MNGFHFDVNAMLDALPNAMIGWAGVFVVTAVIIVVTVALNKFTRSDK